MTDRATAEIIPFPQRCTALAPIGPLAVATADLSQVLDEQHEAIVAWRDALADLRDSLHHLGCNLRALDATAQCGVGL